MRPSAAVKLTSRTAWTGPKRLESLRASITAAAR